MKSQDDTVKMSEKNGRGFELLIQVKPAGTKMEQNTQVTGSLMKLYLIKIWITVSSTFYWGVWCYIDEYQVFKISC